MPASSRDPPKRRYLSSTQRKMEIRKVALTAFSIHGYAATTMEHIANLAGMSKAGLYAHYKSKDELFEDLLINLLPPPFNNQAWLVDTKAQLREAIDAFTDKIYTTLSDPNFIAMLRLLIAESGRVPHLIQRWRDDVILPHIAAQQRMIDQCVERGVMRRSPLTEHFEIVVAPAMYHAIWQIIFGMENISEALEKMRATHHALLLELLGNT